MKAIEDFRMADKAPSAGALLQGGDTPTSDHTPNGPTCAWMKKRLRNGGKGREGEDIKKH